MPRGGAHAANARWSGLQAAAAKAHDEDYESDDSGPGDLEPAPNSDEEDLEDEQAGTPVAGPQNSAGDDARSRSGASTGARGQLPLRLPQVNQ